MYFLKISNVKNFRFFHGFLANYFVFFIFKASKTLYLMSSNFLRHNSAFYKMKTIFFEKKIDFLFIFSENNYFDKVQKTAITRNMFIIVLKNISNIKKNIRLENLKIKPKKYLYIFWIFLSWKNGKNMTFSKEIWIFLMFLGIPEVQIPQKQRFWPSGMVFWRRKVLKNDDGRVSSPLNPMIQGIENTLFDEFKLPSPQFSIL